MRRVLIVALLSLLALPVTAQDGLRYYPRSSGYLVKAAPGVATSGTSEEALYTITVPANTLAEVGDALIVTAHFSSAANTNTKYARLRWTNTSGAISATASTSTSAAYFTFQCFIMRTGATTAVSFEPAYYQDANVTDGTQYRGNMTGIDFGATITLLVTGANATAAADMTLVALSVAVSK